MYVSLGKMLDEVLLVKGMQSRFSLITRSSCETCIPLRHAMLVDQTTEDVTVPLNAQLDCEGRLELANSKFLTLFRWVLSLTLMLDKAHSAKWQSSA